MITVKIEINGKVIGQISASQMNKLPSDNYDPNERWYKTDKGDIIMHNRKDGAKELSRKMLHKLQEKDLEPELKV